MPLLQRLTLGYTLGTSKRFAHDYCFRVATIAIGSPLFAYSRIVAIILAWFFFRLSFTIKAPMLHSFRSFTAIPVKLLRTWHWSVVVKVMHLSEWNWEIYSEPYNGIWNAAHSAICVHSEINTLYERVTSDFVYMRHIIKKQAMLPIVNNALQHSAFLLYFC